MFLDLCQIFLQKFNNILIIITRFFQSTISFTEFTVVASGMGARTWSKASLPDSASQAMGNVNNMKTMSPMPMMGKSIVVRTIFTYTVGYEQV